ncbi:MAG: PAS domain-containing protein [Deltaproteobacteria bacterium]|nr:PAS domain-containing protein [Deltaproteobacteria bacterium]
MGKKKKNPPSVKGKVLKKVTQEKKPKKGIDFPVVGIGASAGGLETLNVFFSNMPSDSNMAFVVIQHLSPQHKSIMASLLEKQTHMVVRQIEDSATIEPNHVYLNPPGKNVALFNRTLHLLEPSKETSINMPIDFFFRSLSEDEGEKAIGIILSGTASDGTMGIRAIKGEGGMAMVQQPDTAKYNGMPRSAVETGLIDFIIPVEKMPEALIRYVRHPFLVLSDREKVADTPVKNRMQKIFALIRSATGNDFSHYKQSTISRRIERRLAVHQIKSLTDYVLFLQKNPAEIQMLFKDLVIGVTKFFRDPEAYVALEQEALPDLLKEKAQDATIRFWVAGCSTGEEAYSLAMTLTETADKIKKHFNVQIFATDIDPVAIEVARKGIYPENIAVDVSPERLKRFFIEETGIFKVRKQLRDMVVFSIQNVIKDPPFSRLDLVSCRNLMIYMDSVLQKKIIPLFHYTLTPGGILFLGTSESIGENTDLFQPLNSKWKVFQRKTSFADTEMVYFRDSHYDAQPSVGIHEEKKLPVTTDVQALVERAILDAYAPVGVVINDAYEILHFVGKTDRYLIPPTGKPSFNILDMVREDLKNKLMVTLHKAVREEKNTTCRDVRVRYNGTFRAVNISVRWLMGEGLPSGFMLVLFEDTLPAGAPHEKKAGAGKTKKQDSDVQNLEHELESTREYLHATIEELETSNEELKSANEELQSVNEELQSTNEELETSKEELQSTNEELTTVNVELENKINEYSEASDDMNNLLAATEIATLFVDTDLCIKNYTPAAASLIHLIQTDIGRPLNDLKTRFEGVDLVALAGNVLKDLNTVELEILSQDDIWYSLKIMPYRTTGNIINGVVMTFVDVHKIKEADKFRRLATVLADSNDAVTVLDLEGNIKAWNKGAERMYGWTESEALKMNIRALLPDDEPNELKSTIAKLNRGEPINPFKSRRKTKEGNILEIWLTITALKDEKGRPVEIASTERDLAWLIQK